MQWRLTETWVATSWTTNIFSKNATYPRLWLTLEEPRCLHATVISTDGSWVWLVFTRLTFLVSSLIPWFNLFYTFIIITVLCFFSFTSSLTIFHTLSVTPWAHPQRVSQNCSRFKRLNAATPLSECLLLFHFFHSVTLPIPAFYLNQIHQSCDRPPPSSPS